MATPTQVFNGAYSGAQIDSAIGLVQNLSVAVQQIKNVKSYGAKCDGVTDDTIAIQSAIAALNSGDILYIPGSSMVRVPILVGDDFNSSAVRSRAAFILDNLQRITIRGSIVNDQFGLSDVGTNVLPGTGNTWHTISSLTASGTTVTATTAVAHGKFTGTVLCVYSNNAADADFTGAVTITVTSPTTFTYPTLGGTPPAAAVGTTLLWAYPDFERTIFRFTRCSDVSIDLKYVGQYRPRGSAHRIGYRVLDFQQSGGVDNVLVNAKLDLYGATNGFSAGSYQSATVGHVSDVTATIIANNIGYGVSLWSRAGRHSDFSIDAQDCHRAGYIAGISDATIRVSVKNFDVAGLLLTGHFDGTTHFGIQDVNAFVTDAGTTENTSYFSNGNSGRFLVGINGEASTGAPTYRNIVLRVSLQTTNTVGKNMRAVLLAHTGAASVFDGITLRGSIDRSQVSSLTGFQTSDELLCRLDAGSEVRNLMFSSFRVKNSATTTNQTLFRRDIQINNNTGVITYLNSPNTSFTTGNFITGGSVRNVDDTSVLVVDGSQTAPSVAGANDPNTGLYFTEDDNLRISCGGVLAYTCNSSAFFPNGPTGTRNSGDATAQWLRAYSTIFVVNNGPTIRSGSGVPAASEPNGSVWLRTDGTGPNLYVRENGAWVSK